MSFRLILNTLFRKGSVWKKCVSLQGSYLWSLKNKIENKNCFYEAYTGTNIGNDF